MTKYKPWMAIFLAVLIAGCHAGHGGRATPDTTAPTVSSPFPAADATDVPLNIKITADFNEAMDASTINTDTFTLTGPPGATPVAGTVSYDATNQVAGFKPSSDLAPGILFTATVTTGVKDAAGNAVAGNLTWSFTTGATADTTPPTVASTIPVAGAVNVPINQRINAVFSEHMDSSTLTTTTFTLSQGASLVSGSVFLSGSGTTASFIPAGDLAPGTLFTATITTGVQDLSGNALAASSTWSFTTGATASAGPAPVVLGTAGTFAILTKSGVTDVPSSPITGDVGASPITGAAIGVTCPEVTGTIYTVDAAGPILCRVIDPTLLTAAVSDMETAYTDAAGRTLPDFTELGAGEIGGLTLVPGLYKWGTNVLISTDVTLSGSANDVWIFQISGDLIQASAINVNLAGGALAKNIFWQVGGGTGVAIGTTAHFEGTLLAIKAINLGTGATANGRLLAQTAVALDQNTVVKPAP